MTGQHTSQVFVNICSTFNLFLKKKKKKTILFFVVEAQKCFIHTGKNNWLINILGGEWMNYKLLQNKQINSPSQQQCHKVRMGDLWTHNHHVGIVPGSTKLMLAHVQHCRWPIILWWCHIFTLWKHHHTTHQSVTLTLSERPSPDTLWRKVISSTGWKWAYCIQ